MKKLIPLNPFPLWLDIKFKEEPVDGRSIGLTTIDEGLITVMICTSDAKAAVPTIVHEAVHVVQFIENYIDGKLDMETFAYMS